MKRLFSFVLALVMLLSVSVPAFAEEAYTKSNDIDNIVSTDSAKSGTIKITNATAGQTYTVYKIFSADVADDKEEGDKTGVTYTLVRDSEAYKCIFGTEANPLNQYFDYNSDGRVTLKETAKDSVALVKYFQELIKDHGSDFPYVSKLAAPQTDSDGKTKNEVTLEFKDLQHGYYLVESSMGAVVTLDSNAPDMTVIDKNQTPGKVDKTVAKNGSTDFVESNDVGIGDTVTYKMEFNATNYAGQERIRYYEVFDSKGNGIWAEFNSFRVKINNEPVPGYYVNQGGDNTNNWTDLGSWGEGVDVVRDQAAWYLVHTGYDTYSILIPWIEGYTVTDNADNETQTITVPEEGEFKYDSPVKVEITYEAAIEPNASIGGTHDNLFNEAHLEWHTKYTQGSSQKDKVTSKTYGLTILKEDFITKANLAGAKFKVYRDRVDNEDGSVELQNPVYVIPTGVDGVYMVDSKGTRGEDFSGDRMDNAREYFAVLRDPDGNPIKNNAGQNVANDELAALGADNQTNEVTTAENGRLVILGLELGDYHFEETQAPGGYNKLTEPFSITITEESNTFISIYADKAGNVKKDSNSADYTYTYSLTNQPVGNSKGAELPATGGEGAFMLISIGTMIAIGFAVLMITQKKMSIYKD